ASATRDMYASEQAKEEQWRKYHGKAVGVPGTVAGMAMALEKYGTMTLAEVLQPAIKLAEEGFPLAGVTSNAAESHFDTLTKWNTDKNLEPFFKDGLPQEPGVHIKLPRLAEAFKLLAKDGTKAFYHGPIGEAVVKAVNKAEGHMTMEDLANYEVKIRKPAEGTYRGYKIYSMCPPSSGGVTLVEILNILENFPLYQWGHNSPKTIHHMAEAFKMAFADRGTYLADPAFVDIPMEGLLSKEYAKELAGKIKADSVMTDIPAGDPSAYEHHSTTHTSVADEAGNIVSFTQTINYFFGSSVIDEKYGIILNNELADFSSNPESVNAPEPGKRPLSSMSPSIVLDHDGEPFLAAGTPGAWRIITSMAQIVSNIVDYDMSIDGAIEAPRFTCRSVGGSPDKLKLESRIPQVVVDALAGMGYEIEMKDAYDLYFGGAQGILWKGPALLGGADSRRDGAAVGY
ncbi:MAG: gamma-glutamyltransferase, partial [Synergistales bacterium]|nr:gamma-glutamyltransferase [Synergistales bacterium]